MVGVLLGGSVSLDADGDVELSGGPLPLLFLRVPGPKGPATKNRMHLDLRVDDYEAAVACARRSGPRRPTTSTAGRAGGSCATQGNEFCIIRPG